MIKGVIRILCVCVRERDYVVISESGDGSDPLSSSRNAEGTEQH